MTKRPLKIRARSLRQQVVPPAIGPSASLARWLDQCIRRGRPGDTLPTSRVLADRFGVSERTVHRQMKGLVASGAIVRIRRRGTLLTPLPVTGDPGVAHATPPSWQSIVTAILSAVAEGGLRSGNALPPVKTMAVRFHVAQSTVSRAYRELAAQGSASRVGRMYWVGGAADLLRNRTTRDVHFFVTQETLSTQHASNPGWRTMIGKMERELRVHGCSMRVSPLDQYRSFRDDWLRRRALPWGLVAGVVRDRDTFEALAESTSKLVHAIPDWPVKVTLIAGGWNVSVRRGTNVLNLGNVRTAVARTVARFLAATTARRVVLFLNEPRIPELDIAAYTRLLSETTHLSPDTRLTTVVQTTPAFATRERLLERLHTLYGDDHLNAIIGKYGTVGLDDMERGLVVTTDADAAYDQLTSADMWIFSHGQDATTALAWLQEHRVPVPGRICVMSLEDEEHSLKSGLSVCTADWDGIGYLLAHSVLGDLPIAKTTRGYIRPPVTLLERQTTRLSTSAAG